MVYDIKRYHLIFPIGAPTSLPLMTPKAQESNLSESENKKCNSPNSIKEQPKKLNLNFSKTVCATSHEFMSSLKNDIDSYQQESIIINKCEKLDVSIDPNYMEKINRFTKSDYDTNLDSKSTLKSIFSKSILRTQDNNEDQIFKNISETEKKVEYKVLDKEEEIHLENIEDGFKIDQKFETSQNQNENLFEINENLQEDLKNENNSINENSKETIEKKEKLNENNVIDNEHNQKINKKEKYTENKELILNEEKFEKKVDKQNINESDEEQPRNEKKKKKTEKNFININKKIPKNSEEKINKEKIEYEADYSLNICN